MRTERLKSAFWFLVIGSWVLGAIFGRWIGTHEVFLELSKAVRITLPTQIDVWWAVIAYFTLSTISVFVLSHILFGVGGAIFLFARGMYDSSFLIAYLETTISGWSISNIPLSEVWLVLIVVLALGVNLPLCIWAGQLGVQRSIYSLNRLRNEPVSPEFGSEPLSNLLMIISVSLVVGLAAAVLFPY